MKIQNVGLAIILSGLLGYLGYEVYRRIDVYQVQASTSPDDQSKSPRVLMIGNSLFSHNDMNEMAEKIAQETDPEHWGNALFGRIAPPGYTLIDHFEDRGDVWKGIGRATDTHWDFVVLHDQSGMMLREPTDPVRRASADAARQFSKLATAHGGTPLLFSTWAYYPFGSAEFPGYWETTSTIDYRYRLLGDEAAMGHVPAGLALQAFRQQYGEEKLGALYIADRHLSVAGTYLAAATLVGVLTNKPTVDIDWHPVGVSPENAKKLRQIADEVVRNESRSGDGR